MVSNFLLAFFEKQNRRCADSVQYHVFIRADVGQMQKILTVDFEYIIVQVGFCTIFIDTCYSLARNGLIVEDTVSEEE